MRVFVIALGICVSSAMVSAAFFMTVFQNKATYEVKLAEPKTDEPAAAVEVPAAPTIDLAALALKGPDASDLMGNRARGAYRVPVPRPNPFDQVADISELLPMSGEDLDDQSAAIGLSPTLELAKEQLDELGDDRALTGVIEPEVLDDITVDPGSLGLLGVIIDTALNHGGQQVQTNRDVGPTTPTVRVGGP